MLNENEVTLASINPWQQTLTRAGLSLVGLNTARGRTCFWCYAFRWQELRIFKMARSSLTLQCIHNLINHFITVSFDSHGKFYKHEAFKSKLIPLEFADYCQFQNLQYGLLYHTNLIYLIRLAPYILFLQGHLYSYCKSNRLYGHKSADYVEILTKAVSGWNVNFNTGFKGLWRLTQV